MSTHTINFRNDNGSQVYLVADLNAQNFQISNNLNK